MRTLVDYREWDKDLIMKGFYDWLFEASALMHRMPVREVKGNGVKYNVTTTRKGASWLSTNDTITENTGTSVQRSAALSRLIGDADVDKFVIKTNSTQDPELMEINQSSMDVLWEWAERLIIGQTTASSNTNQPKGLFTLIAEIESEATTDLDDTNNSQVVGKVTTGLSNHDTSVALTIDLMDALLDQVKLPGGANALIMTRRMRRKLNSLARASGNNLVHDNDILGHMVAHYGNIPIYIDDHLEDSYPDGSSSVLDISSYTVGTTRAGGNDNSVIFAVHLAENGFSIIQAGAFEHELIGTVQNKDAIRHRFKWYTGFSLFNKFAAAALINVLDTAL